MHPCNNEPRSRRAGRRGSNGDDRRRALRDALRARRSGLRLRSRGGAGGVRPCRLHGDGAAHGQELDAKKREIRLPQKRHNKSPGAPYDASGLLRCRSGGLLARGGGLHMVGANAKVPLARRDVRVVASRCRGCAPNPSLTKRRGPTRTPPSSDTRRPSQICPDLCAPLSHGSQKNSSASQ